MHYIIFHSNNDFHCEIFQIENYLPLFWGASTMISEGLQTFFSARPMSDKYFSLSNVMTHNRGNNFQKMNWTITRKRPKRLNFELNTYIPRQNEALGVKFSSKIVSRSFKVIQDKKSRKKAKEKLEMANLIKNFTNHTSK